MLIQCPSCHARAKIPDSSEGAKVRCECGRVYVARAKGTRITAARGTSTPLAIAGFAGLLGLIVVVAVARSVDGEAAAAQAVPLPPEPDAGWSAAPRKDVLSPARREATGGTPEGHDRVTLADGSLVRERASEPLLHLEDTPPELRARIDELVATMLDLELTTQGVRAMRELVEIGRPAIPILLTGFFENPADTTSNKREENRIRCNLIDQALQGITGEQFGYAPGEAGSPGGTSEELRSSSIRQWFAWWHENQQVFTEKRTSDGLEGLIELTEKEKRWLERHEDE